MKRYGYHRTSTREQHLDRGIKEITAYCEQNNLELEKIFTDQQTGKNFNRPRYQVLKEDVLRAGDKLIITEVDNFTSYKNYNIWLIELKRNISGKQEQEVKKNAKNIQKGLTDSTDRTHLQSAIISPIGELPDTIRCHGTFASITQLLSHG